MKFLFLVATLTIAQLAQAHGDLAVKQPACPNFSYKCPDCPQHQYCSYPNSNGCEGSGIPVCQATCFGLTCLTKTLPCPDECPYSCRYSGPPCCPFLGEPTCENLCPEDFDTSKCHVTPCPDNCADDCFYPNADPCCPYSGSPICQVNATDIGSHEQRQRLDYTRRVLRKRQEVSLSDRPLGQILRNIRVNLDLGLNKRESGKEAAVEEALEAASDATDNAMEILAQEQQAQVEAEAEAEATAALSTGHLSKQVDEAKHHESSVSEKKDGEICIAMIVPCPPECPYTCIYPHNVPCPYTHRPRCPSDIPNDTGSLNVPPNAETDQELIYSLLEEKVEDLINGQEQLVDQAQQLVGDELDLLDFVRSQRAPGVDAVQPRTVPHMSAPVASASTWFTEDEPAPVSATPSRDPPLQLCPHIVIPCPAKCPDTCQRPIGAPCPLAVKGFCP